MLISLLLALLIIAVIIYVVNLVIGMLALPAPIKTIALIVIALIGLFYILNLLGVTHASIGCASLPCK